MNADPGTLVRGIGAGICLKDYDQGSVLLELYRSLPAEFRLEDNEASDSKTMSLLPALTATTNLAIWELERYYGIDLTVTRTAVLKYLENFGRPNRPTLLFLRGFRSSKRLWIENAFTFESNGGHSISQRTATLVDRGCAHEGAGSSVPADRAGGCPTR